MHVILILIFLTHRAIINDVSYQEYFIDYDSEEDGPSKENPYYVIKNEHTIQQMEITSGEYQLVENKK